MKELSKGLEKISNPPEKVRLMYEAVSELIGEKRSVAALKVADITNRAGIGKGTAYEYFTSKEELISFALVYEYSKKFFVLMEEMKKVSDFESRFMKILDWLQGNREYNSMFARIINIVGNGDKGEDIKIMLPEELEKGVSSHVISWISKMMHQAAEEGLISETDEKKRAFAFLSALMEYNMTLQASGKKCIIEIEDSKMRQFVYESMIKALN